MSFPVIDLLRVLQGIIAVLGIVTIYFATKSYRKTKSGSMLFLALGFLFVTVGAIFAGILYEFLIPNDLLSADVASAGCEVIGFALIVYSIVGTRD